MKQKIAIVAKNVNTVSPDIYTPTDLIDISITGFKTSLGILREKHSAYFFYIAYKQMKNGGQPVRLDSTDFMNHVYCGSRNTVTNNNKRLEELGLITITRLTTCIDGKNKTINYYSINWYESYLFLKDKIFGSSRGEKYLFILRNIISSFTTSCAQLLCTPNSLYTNLLNKFNNLVGSPRVSGAVAPSPAGKPIKKFIKFNFYSPKKKKEGPMTENELHNDYLTFASQEDKTFHWTEDMPCPSHFAGALQRANLSHHLLDTSYERFRNFWAVEVETKIPRTEKRWDEIWEKYIQQQEKFLSYQKDQSPAAFKVETNTKDEMKTIKRDQWASHATHLYEKLLGDMGKADFISWVQEPDHTFLIDPPLCAIHYHSSFTRTMVRQRFRDIFMHHGIEIS
jgi:hypothetical protein